MKRKTRERPLRQLGDSKKMVAAADWAEHHGLEIYRTTDYCYQIEGYNFWPDKGTIQTESKKRCNERSLSGLAEILKKPLLDEAFKMSTPDEISFDLGPRLTSV